MCVWSVESIKLFILYLFEVVCFRCVDVMDNWFKQKDQRFLVNEYFRSEKKIIDKLTYEDFKVH